MEVQQLIAADQLKLEQEGAQLKEESWPWEPSDALRDEVQVVARFTSASRASLETCVNNLHCASASNMYIVGSF
jgi:hypothetical protein